ncbi:MAG TPA: phosphoenolpyruvate--protein phosphotransferase [Pedomonas sp.]|nr:phosphoenolpyruvate--protein phosphotransferase [Pedomonas sp.]
MASRGTVQAKLNQVVHAIAEAMASEVCSIYLLRDGWLELYATRGLSQDAVHVTRLALSEGLVGNIARNGEPLNLAEARAHADFAYRPETGEDLYHSFAGVPILRRGQALGVLCVQHMEQRQYEDEEIEALQTVAMVLAEMVANTRLVDEESIARARAQNTGSMRLAGTKLVDGLARGVAVMHEPRIVIEHTVAEDIDAEKQRVRAAFQTMRAQIDRMMSQAEFGGPGEHEEILETYKMFAFDEGWSRRINEAIESGLTAEAAIERVQQRTRVTMRNTKDPFFLERLHDLDDLANRLLRIVSGQMGTAAQTGLTQDTILIARNLGPAELLEYDRRFLKGVVLEEGSPTAHVTILARAMSIPMLGRIKQVREVVVEGDLLLLDGNNDSLLVRPAPDVVRQFEAHVTLRQERQAAYAKLRDLPAVTLDDQRIELMMNAGLRVDLPGLDVTNADGIGLFRTEFQFLVSATLPRREVQTRLYSAVLKAAEGRPVIFRTVDIGGDKAVPYLRDEAPEENPAMGWRALRVALERQGLLKVQARALLDAAAGQPLNLMFPMVTEPWEFQQARAIVEEQVEYLRSRGMPLPTKIHYGVMMEVPALAWRLDALLPNIDFLSIGTNDLIQFLLAADRSNPKLADRYDWVSPGILRFLKFVVDQAQAAGKTVSVCGEMGGRPLEALALLGLGVRRLSITQAAIGPIKMVVRHVHLGRLRALMEQVLTDPWADVRRELEDFAEREGVPL